MAPIVHQYRCWPENAVTEENWRVVDPTRPWSPSPEPELFTLPPNAGRQRHIVRPEVDIPRAVSESRRPRASTNADFLKRKTSKLSVRYWKDRWSTKANKENVEDWPCLHGRLRATPAAFKAYGYWARPTIYGVTVDNAYKDPEAGPSNLSRNEVEAVMESLKDPDGTTHPERWSSRVEHPSLPPRPSLWPTPPSSPRPDVPPPSKIQLNPLLEHRLVGKSGVKFDLREGDQVYIVLGEIPPAANDPSHIPGRIDLIARGPNGGQPATYPGVSEMKIIAVADETLLHFPWPYTIRARDGLPVTVQDVIISTMINFTQFMTGEELAACERPRKWYIDKAFHRRLYDRHQAVEGEGIRRVDYLGDRVIFRGLEPAPGDDGWIMFVGPVN